MIILPSFGAGSGAEDHHQSLDRAFGMDDDHILSDLEMPLDLEHFLDHDCFQEEEDNGHDGGGDCDGDYAVDTDVEMNSNHAPLDSSGEMYPHGEAKEARRFPLQKELCISAVPRRDSDGDAQNHKSSVPPVEVLDPRTAPDVVKNVPQHATTITVHPVKMLLDDDGSEVEDTVEHDEAEEEDTNNPANYPAICEVDGDALDAKITKQLNSLSLQQRDNALHDVYGVADIIQETPGLVKKSLTQLELWLRRKAAKGSPRKNKAAAYGLCQFGSQTRQRPSAHPARPSANSSMYPTYFTTPCVNRQ
jgi:hypothetical protein